MDTKGKFERDITTLRESITTAMEDIPKGIRTREEVTAEITILRDLLVEQITKLDKWLQANKSPSPR